MDRIEFFAPGLPKPQPRVRAFHKPGFGVRVYTPGTAENWKSAIAMAAKPFVPASPILGPVALHLVLYLPRPQRLCRKHDPEGPIPCGQKPDFDNYAKAIADALTLIGMWLDDGQVYDGRCIKFYVAKPGHPYDRAGAMVRIIPAGTDGQIAPTESPPRRQGSQ